jgi:hypothetical protein
VIAVVLLAGCAGMFFRQGVFLAGLAGIGVPIVLTHRLDRWTAHHADRFPYGVDLINDSSTSNLLLKGEWEEAARVTTSELSWATIGLAGAAIVVAALRAPSSPIAPDLQHYLTELRSERRQRWTRSLRLRVVRREVACD